jgi:hypothetical protein
MTKKNVEDKLEEVDEPVIDFDVTTKPEGTLNARVNQKLKFIEDEKKRAAEDQILKSLPSLEKDAEELLQQEVIVIMGKDMLNKLKEVFDSCKERGQEHIDEVNTNDLIGEIAADTYFEQCLDSDVRESLDGARESLESLLHRILKTYKSETIQWHTFLGFFTKRGRLRDSEKLNLQLQKVSNNT